MLHLRRPPAGPTKSRPLSATAAPPASGIPALTDLIAARDWTGAAKLLEFEAASKEAFGQPVDSLQRQWMAYICFHTGDFQRAFELYDELASGRSGDPWFVLCRGICRFFLGQDAEAENDAKRGPDCRLRNRLLFHLSHRSGDEEKLLLAHRALKDTVEDQLCLASVHYARNHYQEGIDVYKKMWDANRDYQALGVYIAMCYYKLDYFDATLEIVHKYLGKYPDSAVALNLKACTHFRLYDGKTAEVELNKLKQLGSDTYTYGSDLVAHNMVVFRYGEEALRVLPPLVDVVPEARLNLAVYYLRHNAYDQAYDLLKDLTPTTPSEIILKGVVHTFIGQAEGSAEHLTLAKQFFRTIGTSPTECDTVPGRQAMASAFFLLGQFKDVLTYLTSIKTYLYQDDDFNWDLGMSLAATGNYVDAEEALHMCQNERYRSEFAYLAWLARCYIMNGKARLAWDLYMRMDGADSFRLLLIIAHDCYRVGAFFVSARAFDMLGRLDQSTDHWEGKRGACIGVFQQVISGEEQPEALQEVIVMLRNEENPQVDYILGVIQRWMREM